MEMGRIHEFEPHRTRDALISKGGQVSIPAEIRRRWGTDEVRLVDLGDRLIVRPVGFDDPPAGKGSLPLPAGLTAEGLRATGRSEDESLEQRRPTRP